MRETSAPLDVVDDRNPGRADVARWIVPVVLLVLVTTLVASASFSSPSPNAWSTTDTILFILTALLCTLVAASLTLTGCARWLTGIERSIQPMAADIAALQETQAQLCEALRRSGQESTAKTLLDERNQHFFQDSFGRLANSLQAAASDVTALREMLQAREEATHTAIAGLATGGEKLAAEVQALHEVVQKAAGGVADLAREQAAAHGVLQDGTQALSAASEAIQHDQRTLLTEIEKLAAAAQHIIDAVTAGTAEQTATHETAKQTLGEVTSLGARQEAAGEAWRAHTEATATVMTALTAGQEKLTTDVRQLQDLLRAVADGVTDVTSKQAAAYGPLQDSTRAVAAATEVIEQSQQALRMDVEKAVKTADQIIAAVSTMAVEQTTARETTRHMIGEVANAAIAALTAGRMPCIPDSQQTQAPAPAATASAPLDVTNSEVTEVDVPLRLPASQAITHGEQIRYEVGPDRDNLGYWTNGNDWAQWQMELTRPGRFQVSAEIAAVASGRFQVTLGDQRLEGSAPNTGDYGRFERVELGTLELPAAGPVSLAVRPIPEGWQPMNLKSVELVPLT